MKKLILGLIICASMLFANQSVVIDRSLADKLFVDEKDGTIFIKEFKNFVYDLPTLGKADTKDLVKKLKKIIKQDSGGHWYYNSITRQLKLYVNKEMLKDVQKEIDKIKNKGK